MHLDLFMDCPMALINAEDIQANIEPLFLCHSMCANMIYMHWIWAFVWQGSIV